MAQPTSATLPPEPETVKPVFLLTRDLPTLGDRPLSTREICGVAEKITGYNTIEGAQQIGGLWRLYPKTRTAQVQLQVGGISLRNTHAKLYNDNPFLTGRGHKEGRDEEIETTRLVISNIPISFSNKEIEEALENLGCQAVSRIIDECDRDDTGKLTRWKTGRRFLYIAMPKEPLPTQISMGVFTARLYHREQKTRTLFCGNCLSNGHRKHECGAPVVCRLCKQPGHKAGDLLCEGVQRETTPETKQTDVYIATVENEADKLETEVLTEVSEDEESDYPSSSNEGDSIKKPTERKRKRGDKKKKALSPNTSSDISPERQAKLVREADVSQGGS